MNSAREHVAVSGSAEQSQARRCIIMVAACPFPMPRGTPVRILRMAEALAKRGHDVHVATYHLGENAADYPFTTHRIPAVPTYKKLNPGPSYQKLAVVDPLLAMKVARLARELEPEVIHAHHYEGLLAALPARWLHGVPIVYDAHVLLDGEIEYYSLGLPQWIRRHAARFIDRRVPRRANHVIVVSDEIRERLCEGFGYPRDFVTVVANGVEAPFFERRREALPRDGKRRLIFTGNLALYQGTDKMLQAFEIVLRRHPETRLLIVTDSRSREFHETAKKLGVDHAVEYRSAKLAELPGLIASADVALNPRTKCPGTPQKLLNYLACAVPVVSFQGSAKYLRDEANALVVPDDDIDGFAQAVSRLLENDALARRIAAEAGRFAECELSWERNVRQVEGVYAAMLSSGSPREQG